MTSKEDYILWLPSWYPNKFEPFNGDFIQRHAQATSSFCKIIVCHFPQLGHNQKVVEASTNLVMDGNLEEMIHYVRFVPSGFNILDRLRYNYSYYQQVFRFLKNHFKARGFPKLVHAHIPIKAGNIALWIQRNYKIRFIVSEQSSYYVEGGARSFSKRGIVHQAQVGNVFRKAVLATNVSETIGDVLASKFHLPKVITVYNTVNTNVFNFSQKKNKVFTFIHVSSLAEQKNITGILNAFGMLKRIRGDWKLQIVGPYTRDIERRIYELQLENQIELLGQLNYSQVAAYVKCAHVFVLFSLYENFPCVVVEALCCGLPVVSSDVAGVKEAVGPTNGILVAMKNEKDFASALAQIKETYGFYNHQKISEDACCKYSYQKIGAEFFNLYNQQ